MSKAVLISIRPKWCEKIINGDKTIEVRKTRPKLDTPFKCYIYCTLPKYPHEDFIATDYPRPQFYGGGKVIGEFTCDRIYELETKARGGSYYVKNEDQPTTNFIARQSCLTLKDMHDYLHAQKGYGWHIIDLRIYDAPKCLFEFWAERLCNREPSVFGCRECCDCDKRPPQSWCYVEEGERGEENS